MKLTRTIGVTAVAALTIAGFAVSGAEAASKRATRTLPEVGAFVDAHGTAAVKRANPSLSTAEIETLSNDSTARVTASGKILFVDRKISASTISASSIATNVTGIPIENYLSLNSRPGSSKTIVG